MGEAMSAQTLLKGRSIATLGAFFLTLFGGIAATIVFALSIFYQYAVLLPSLLSQGLGHLFINYLILDFFTILGGILMYSSAIVIFYQRWWPAGVVLAFFGAFLSVAPFSVILGLVGGIINLCSRPEPQIT